MAMAATILADGKQSNVPPVGQAMRRCARCNADQAESLVRLPRLEDQPTLLRRKQLCLPPICRGHRLAYMLTFDVQHQRLQARRVLYGGQAQAWQPPKRSRLSLPPPVFSGPSAHELEAAAGLATSEDALPDPLDALAVAGPQLGPQEVGT